MSAALKKIYYDYEYKKADKALRRWARFQVLDINTCLRSTLGELVEYGLHIPSGYGEQSYYYPDVMNTQRIWAFMPTNAMRAIYVYYCYGGKMSFNAVKLGMSLNKFKYQVHRGLNFFVKHQNCDFNSFFSP